MSKDFKQYLSDQPIFMFKLVDGTTVIATLEDIKDNIVTIKDAQEIQLIGDSTLSWDMSIHKWMFMSDERTVNSSASRGYVDGKRADTIILGIINEENSDQYLLSIPSPLALITPQNN